MRTAPPLLLLLLLLASCAEGPLDERGGLDDTGEASAALAVCGGSIQAAINAAPAGATLDICAGTYAERLVINGKNLTLRGIAGAASTIIDAGGLGRALDVVNAPGSGVVIKGLTLRNGKTNGPGGGLRCTGSKLVINASVFFNNQADGGGGLRATGCAVSVATTRFEKNNGRSDRGGGAWLVNSTGQVATSTFLTNKAEDGGGVAIDEGSVQLRDSELRGNIGTVRGGGLYHASNATVLRTQILDNASSWIGGGVYVLQHAPTISLSTIRGNTSVNDGGGFYIHRSQLKLLDSTIADNIADDDGGGLRVFESRVRLERNTIEANRAGDGGGGIRLSHLQSALIDNFVVDNIAASIGGGIELDNDSSTVRGGLVSGNRAHRGGGFSITLTPIQGALVDDVEILDNAANYGGGVYLADNYNPVSLSRLTVAGNESGRGGGLYVRATHLTLDRTVFDSNEATIEGGAIVHAVAQPCTATPCPPAAPTVRLEFITAYKNVAPAGSALWTNATGLSLESSILSHNSGTAVVVVGVTAPTWRYNDTLPATFSGMAVPTGINGNLAVDPKLVAPATGDFHLAAGSPARNAGDPAKQDIDASRADMGRYGGPGPM